MGGTHEASDARATAQPIFPDDEISLLSLLSVLLRRRRLVAGFTIGTAFLVVLVTLLMFQPTYTSEASFIPQTSQRGGVGSGLQALAGQFGVAVPSDEGGESPQFYADLIRTREILGRVLRDTFEVVEPVRGDPVRRRGTLVDLLEIAEGEPEAIRREEGLRWLREKAVTARTTRETGVVQVSVTTPWPHVSRDIAERLLELANDFNLRTRQSRASAEREFISRRLAEAQAELRETEDQLRRFLENNRQFENSPELSFEHDRLQREVGMRQQVFTSLSQSYEDARISEVRDTPVITVVDPPREPAERDSRGLALRSILGALLGGMVGVVVAFGREFVARNKEDGDPEYEEFHEAWEDAVNDLRSFVPGRSKKTRGVGV